MIKPNIRKTFGQLYRSNVAPALEAAGVAPQIALGLMRQMTGARILLVVGGRCCPEAPESMDLFVLELCYCIGPLVQKWCEQGFCVDVVGKPLTAWAYADDLFLAAGAAWKLTKMLSDLSVGLARLVLSLCIEVGKCAWQGVGIDDLAPVYLAASPSHESHRIL